MKEYELCIEAMTPCGGSKHAQRQILEVEAESPEAYVKANAPLPIMDVADFGVVNIAAQLLFAYVLIYVTLLINAKEWKWTEWIMEIGRHSLWVLCIHSIEMSVFPWDILWRFVDPNSVIGVLAHFILRSAGIVVCCVALKKGQHLIRKWKKQHSNKQKV